ncbi:MAG: hypothetical protein LBB38_00280 [Puniceicoccales bacterium]|jgi:hypothetical protein|nr:hypothetical protein [Puniceicoccales bacterium]
MNTVSAYSLVANSEILKGKLVESINADGGEGVIEGAADLLLTVATELGIGKIAIKFWQVIRAVFGWLIKLFEKKTDGGEELPEEFAAIVKDAKSLAVVGGKPRNREKHALHRQLLALSSGWDGGNANVWVVMRAIRQLPKDKQVVLSATTFGELTAELNGRLGIDLKENGKTPKDKPLSKGALRALNAVLKKHAKEVS